MEIISTGQEVDPAATQPASEIVRCGDEAQVRAFAQLRAHLGQMLNNPAFSDVEFVCNDGKRVLASRILLAGRSDVLKGMFMSGMADSNLSHISLPEISSPVLLSVFEFFYTGTLSKHHPQSWRMACELIVASRFFLEPNLEMITRKVMHTIICGVAQDLPKVALLLTEAVKFKSLCDDEMDVNLKELVTILSSNWSDSNFVWSLSEEAFDYLLEKSKGNFDDDDELRFTEYLRFRQVIRCCITKSDEEQPVEELLNFLVPDEHQALSLLNPGNAQKVGSLPKDASISSDSSLFHKDEKIRNLAIKLSSNIDCRKINPLLLATVVEPLNIISAAEILDSFRFHALQSRTVIFKRSECGWDHGESYRTLEQGFVIKKNSSKIGLAVSKTPISRSHGIYQWRFTVEEYPDTFCELGFIYYGGGVGILKPKLQGTMLSEHDHARVLNFNMSSDDVFHSPVALVNWQAGRCGWKAVLQGQTFKSLSVLFTFNASERTCSLSFGGENVGVVWNNLPTAVCSPAVSLGASSAGRVRIELVSGFDIL